MQQASYKPSDSEIAQLVTILQMPGFEIYKRIQVGEIDQFQVDLMNVDPTSPHYTEEVRVKHNLALAAGMFYERVQQKVAGYITRFGEKNSAPKVLPDMTEEVFG